MATCPTCGAELPSADGECLACLMKQGQYSATKSELLAELKEYVEKNVGEDASLPEALEAVRQKVLALVSDRTQGLTEQERDQLKKELDQAVQPSTVLRSSTAKEGSTRRTTLRCSFCGKDKNDVAKLIAGPKVYICNECVLLCADILAEAKPLGAAERPRWVGAKPETALLEHFQADLVDLTHVSIVYSMERFAEVSAALELWLDSRESPPDGYGVFTDSPVGSRVFVRGRTHTASGDLLTKIHYRRVLGPDGDWKNYPSRALWMLELDDEKLAILLDRDGDQLFVHALAKQLATAETFFREALDGVGRKDE